jgi:hypothetical protein
VVVFIKFKIPILPWIWTCSNVRFWGHAKSEPTLQIRSCVAHHTSLPQEGISTEMAERSFPRAFNWRQGELLRNTITGNVERAPTGNTVIMQRRCRHICKADRSPLGCSGFAFRRHTHMTPSFSDKILLCRSVSGTCKDTIGGTI